MQCFMCFGSDSKLQMIQTDLDNDIVKGIKFVFPDFLIPESKESVFICSTCLEQISFFYTVRKASLQNCSRLKHFNALLKGSDHFKCDELSVIINSGEESEQCKHQIVFKDNPKSKYLLSSDERDAKRIKEEEYEDADYSQQLVNDEGSLNHLQHHAYVGSFEFVDTNKFTEKDSNLTSKNSRHKDQLKIHESGNNRLKCSNCLKAFTTTSKLERHSRVHTGEKPYKCTTCQKTFTRLDHLKRHILTHTGEKPHECDVCHKTFSRKSSLIYHKSYHKNVRPHKCAVCNKEFITSSSLSRHMFTHTGEKPHQCHLCEYKSAKLDHLKTHIRFHTGEKPYSCKHCEKSFTTKSNLKKHEHRLHSDEDSD